MVVVAGCCSAFSCVLCQDSDFSVEKKRKTETCHEAMHCPSQFLEPASASKVSNPWLVQDFPLVPQTVDTTVSQASKLFFFSLVQFLEQNENVLEQLWSMQGFKRKMFVLSLQ